MANSEPQTAPICRCRVIYLGSSVPRVTKDGLQGIQEPLRELYPDDDALASPGTSGIDSWLSVWSNGILLENVDGNGRNVKRFYPIESLHYCAAVRYVPVIERPIFSRSLSRFRIPPPSSESVINGPTANGHHLPPLHYVAFPNGPPMHSIHSMYPMPPMPPPMPPIVSRMANVPIISSISRKGKSKYLNGHVPSLRYVPVPHVPSSSSLSRGTSKSSAKSNSGASNHVSNGHQSPSSVRYMMVPSMSSLSRSTAKPAVKSARSVFANGQQSPLRYMVMPDIGSLSLNNNGETSNASNLECHISAVSNGSNSPSLVRENGSVSSSSKATNESKTKSKSKSKSKSKRTKNGAKESPRNGPTNGHNSPARQLAAMDLGTISRSSSVSALNGVSNGYSKQLSMSSPASDQAGKFLPLDSPFLRHVDGRHPPLFACILRRTTGIKVLECHAFICKRETAANALVRCCFHAYADMAYAKQVEEENPYSQLNIDNNHQNGRRSRSSNRALEISTGSL